MSSVRRDIITGAYVIVAEQRGNRPINVTSTDTCDAPPESCPFCPGNEHMTPAALGIGEENWQTRFFPNKYPALTGLDDFIAEDPLYGGYDGSGKHEIFVDTRSHYDDLKDFSLLHVERLILALKERYEVYRNDKNITHVQVFKNRGSKAGATQKHSHWQLLSGKFVPLVQETILKRLSDYKEDTGKCLYCVILEKEISEEKRVVFENDCFIAIAPYASRFTYETWILPKKHVSFFSELDKNDIFYLAEALLHVVAALEKIKDGIDYNLILMDAPKTDSNSLFHWHIQVLPRMGNLAGYEFSTASYINHITPERAAETLRSLIFGGNR